MRFPEALSACVVSVALLTPLAAHSQVDAKREYGPWVWGIQGGAVYQSETDFSDAEGDFSISRFFVQPSFGYAWDRRNSVSLSLGFGDSDYDFAAGGNIEGLNPWGRIRDYRVALPMRFSPTDKTNAIIIPSIRSDAEDGASLDDGRTQGVLAGVGWKFSDTLTLGPGFGWFSELGGGSAAFPIIIVDWAITEKISLSTGRGLAASQGPGLDLNYKLNDKWTVGLSGRYERVRFALDDDSASEGAFGEDKSLPLLVSVRYSPWPMTSVSAFVGSDFEGELTLEDSNTDTLANSEYDVAFSFGFVFRSRF